MPKMKVIAKVHSHLETEVIRVMQEFKIHEIDMTEILGRIMTHLSNDALKKVLKTLSDARTQLKDLSNGYPERELHQPIAVTMKAIEDIIGGEDEE